MSAGAVSAPLIIPNIQRETHRTKTHLDTNTPVTIHSDTPDVLIFFTLDGSWPAAVQRGLARGSRKYSGPILLPAGRVVIRAVAVTSDRRESSTVTKVFYVEHVESNREESIQNDQQHPSDGVSPSADSSLSPPEFSVQHPFEGALPDSSLSPSELKMMGDGCPPSGPHFLNSRLGFPTQQKQTGSPQRFQSARSGVLKQLGSTQILRIHRETNFLRCARCLSFRPSDPFSRFCAQCGAAVPPLIEQRLPPDEGGQVVCCVFCNTLVPANTQTCLTCEAPICQQLQPKSSLILQDHVRCFSCGSGNPAHISSCLTCESRLHPAAWSSNPSVGSANGRMLTCSRCKRLNHSDARYCDWCGSKPGHAASCAVCWRCGASGHPYAFYCTTCGAFLEAPPKPTSCNNIEQPIRVVGTNQVSVQTSYDDTWQAMPSSDPAPSTNLAPPTAEQYTQTVGLYYPSATELQRKEQQKELQLRKQQATRNRQPLLTAISPGRGYWRKQLDHVCAHLRNYAQNNVPFRTLLGEPRLGRMVSAVIQEDNYEVSVTVNFVLAEREKQQVCPTGDSVGPASRTETLSSITERSVNSSILRSDQSTGLMKPPKLNLTPKPLVKNVQLLKELGPGRGQVSVIQELLDQGADPSCCGSDGRHTLVVAVVNGHHDVLPVLVQRGADVDQQSGQMRNTALHEAASLGSEGLTCAQVLLSCKATVTQRNAGGQTAYDVAVNSGCNDMVSLLAAQTGLDFLDKLKQPKLNLDVS